jgi:hypothetical protein
MKQAIGHALNPQPLSMQEAEKKRMHVRIADLGNGSWVGEWTPFAAGSYSVRILVNSVEAYGSPFTVFAVIYPTSQFWKGFGSFRV